MSTDKVITSAVWLYYNADNVLDFIKQDLNQIIDLKTPNNTQEFSEEVIDRDRY